jgi:hypothetical protein
MISPQNKTKPNTESEIERLKAEIKHLKAQSRQKLRDRDAHIQALYQSSSWKIARPIRALKKAALAIRHWTPRLLQWLPTSGAAAGPAIEDETLAIKPPALNADADVSEDEAIALISASPLFDPNWYLAQYPDVANAGVSPALHYVREGSLRKRKPSIFFDPEYYLGQNPAAAASRVNPLVHYLKIGQHEGYKPLAVLDPSPRSPGEATPPIIESPANWLAPAVQWARHANLISLEPEFGLLFGGALIARFLSARDVTEAAGCIAAFCRLMGLEAAEHIHLVGSTDKNGQATKTAFDPTYDEARFGGLGPEFASGFACLTDAWFPNGSTLRLRLGQDEAQNPAAERYVIRAFQADVTSPWELSLVGEELLPGSGPAFVDLNLVNPLLPVLLVLATPDGITVDLGVLPFPSLCRGGLHQAELSSIGEQRNPTDNLQSVSDAFLREYMERSNVASPRAIQQVAVRLTGATGAERIFSPSVREWLACVFGVRVVPATDDLREQSEGIAYLHASLRASEGVRVGLPSRTAECLARSLTLVLPPDALPTISALISHRLHLPSSSTAAIGSFLIADFVTCNPRWSIALPALDEDIIGLQPNGSAPSYPVLTAASDDARTRDDGATQGTIGLPLSIHYRRPQQTSDAALLMPLAPDAPGPVLGRGLNDAERARASITAIVTCTTETGFRHLIGSLARQTLSADKLNVVALIQPNGNTPVEALSAELERWFRGRHRIVISQGNHWDDLRMIVETVRDRFTLLVRDTIVLHDSRTLETLAMMADRDRVASAGCTILQETSTKKGSIIRFHSGGFFPSHVSVRSVPRLIFQTPDCLDALAGTTYPVAGNSFDLALLRTDIFEQLSAGDTGTFVRSSEDLWFALKALSAGYRHLCTSAVSVTAINASAPREHLDPVGYNFIKPAAWGKVFSSVTVLSELR